MTKQIRVIGPKDRPSKGEFLVDTTSRAKKGGTDTWRLSPFYLGPCKLYWGLKAVRMENAWQFSKVYTHQIVHEVGSAIDGSTDGDYICESYFEWALKGFQDTWAHRYPMGKGARPKFSYWAGHRLDYIKARKAIYVPLYANAVKSTPVYKRLVAAHAEGKELTLWDYDGYDYGKLGMTLREVLDNPKRKMGHAFVLAMMLEEPGLVEECKTYQQSLMQKS